MSPNTPDSRRRRKQAGRDFRRTAIVQAAKRLVLDKGVTSLTVRAIAAEAGYTPGAVYSYFDGMHMLTAELLAQELADLARQIRDGAGESPQVRGQLAAVSARIVERFGRKDDPLTRFLGVLLAEQGPLPDSDMGRVLTGRILQLLLALSKPVAGVSGADKRALNHETILLAAVIVGLGLIERTGRLELMDTSAEQLLDQYLERLGPSPA